MFTVPYTQVLRKNAPDILLNHVQGIGTSKSSCNTSTSQNFDAVNFSTKSSSILDILVVSTHHLTRHKPNGGLYRFSQRILLMDVPICFSNALEFPCWTPASNHVPLSAGGYEEMTTAMNKLGIGAVVAYRVRLQLAELPLAFGPLFYASCAVQKTQRVCGVEVDEDSHCRVCDMVQPCA